MSVIVALRYKNGVLIGADKQITNSHIKYDSAIKIHKTKYSNIVLGTVGSLRDNDIIETMEEIIPYKDILDKTNIDKKYIIKNIIPILFKTFKDNDRLESGCFQSNFLLASNNKIFVIYPDGSVIEFDTFASLGCGEELAKGYLETLKNINSLNEKEAEKIIKNCILKCCENDCYIDNKIDIINLKEE